MNVLDLFSGVGGFAIGLERAGMQTVAFCEIDAKARKVLEAHWPEVPIFPDVRTLTKRELENHGITQIDVICGGFPCQDISAAGSGVGIIGERSGLWREYYRLIEALRPRWVIIENVAALRSKGLALVIQNLSEIGYVGQFHCIPASAVGASHQRDRIWIVAYPDPAERGLCDPGERRAPGELALHAGGPEAAGQPGERCENVADADCSRQQQPGRDHGEGRGRPGGCGEESRGTVADSDRQLSEGCVAARGGRCEPADGGAVASLHGRIGESLARHLERGLSGIRGRWVAGPGQEQYGWEPPRAVSVRPKAAKGATES